MNLVLLTGQLRCHSGIMECSTAMMHAPFSDDPDSSAPIQKASYTTAFSCVLSIHQECFFNKPNCSLSKFKTDEKCLKHFFLNISKFCVKKNFGIMITDGAYITIAVLAKHFDSHSCLDSIISSSC